MNSMTNLMVSRWRIRTIFKLAMPVGIALSSNIAMSVIDLAMVGRLGTKAIAAVGLSVFSSTLVLGFMAGIAPGVQGLAARRRGEGSTEPECLPLNAGLGIALVAGIPLTIACYLLTPVFFSLISSDPEVTRIGVSFLRILYLGIVAAGMNAGFKGHWSGVEKPKVYMAIVVFMVLLNAALNYVLIFGHFGISALGVAGAAIGTVSASYVGVVANLLIAYVWFKKDGFARAKPELAVLKNVARLGVPSAVQQFFFSAGYTVFLWLVGRVGTAELAAATVLVRITMIMVLLATSLGIASATLVSKDVGAGDIAGAAQWGWDAAKLSVIGISLLGVPLFLFPKLVLSLFLTDPHTISIAIVPLRLVAATTGIGSLLHIFAYTLYSVGDGHRVNVVALGMQWLLFLPAVWIIGPYLHHGLLQIWLVQMTYGSLATVLVTAIWIDGRWKGIKI